MSAAPLPAIPPTMQTFGVAGLSELDLTGIRVNDYDPIAEVFDEVMGHDFHQATHHIRLQAVRTLGLERPLRCLDLCSGTGLFLTLLSERHSVLGWGFDASPGQVAVARVRAERHRLSHSYTVARVEDAQFPIQLDLVTINFDALNHLRSLAAWKSIFKRTFCSLRPGGAFLFDINLPDRLVRDWNTPEVIAKERLTYIQLAFPALPMGTGVLRATPMIIYFRREDGHFERRLALIEQFAAPLGEVIGLLRACGFSETRILQEPDANPRGHLFNKNRAFILATK